MPINTKKAEPEKLKKGRKRRIRKHVIADLSANHVERLALLNGYTVEFIGKDYGYDLTVYTFNAKGEFENGTIYIQLKATDKPKFVNARREIAFPADKRDLRTWFSEPNPVIFILFDAKQEIAYWIYLQQHLRNLPTFDIDTISDNFSIRIPVTNVLDKSSFQLFRTYKENNLKEISNVVTYQ